LFPIDFTDPNRYKKCTWTECTVTCGKGTQRCPNSCANGAWGAPGCDVKYQSNPSQTCNDKPCPTIKKCSNFDSCTVTCGTGTQKCTNECENGDWGQTGCSENDKINTQSCNDNKCPSIRQCTEFSSCSASCGTGTQTCDNFCDNGNWGQIGCDKDAKTNTQNCNEQKCPIVRKCTEFGSCSLTCGGGKQTCENFCDHGNWGQKGCDEKDKTNSKNCNEQKCPTWGAWDEWSKCSVSCDEGTKTRNRKCELDGVEKKGECLEGESSETTSCNLELCVYVLGISVQTSEKYSEDLFDRESDSFKKKSAAIQLKLNAFTKYNNLGYVEKIVVTEFIARKTSRRRRSVGDPAVDVSVDFTIAEKKSLADETTKVNVQKKLVDTTDTSIDEDGDSNSVLSGSASIDRCNENGFTIGNTCMENSTCMRLPDKYYCSCNEGFRMITNDSDEKECKEACDLFSVECTVAAGFTISVVEECRAEQYGHLTDLTGLFAQEKDLEAVGGSKPDDLDEKCSFKKVGDDYKASFGFDTCGTASHAAEDDYTYFTTYVNHQAKLGEIITSQLDQNELQCKLLNVDLQVGNDLSSNDEKLGTTDIKADQLTKDFDLKLVAGTEDKSTFTALQDDQKVDVGSKIHIKLDYTDSTGNNFQFALSDCTAEAASESIDLYEKFCPNAKSSIIGLDWLKSTEYNLNIFRIGDATSLTFKCTVSVYPDGAKLCDCDKKENCPVSDRKRRDSETTTTTVSTTVQLSQNEKRSNAQTPFIGALGICLFNLF